MAVYEIAVDALALVAATAKTVLELGTGAQQRVKIKEFWWEFDGVTATAVPVKVEVGRFSAGVTTATTLALDKQDPADGTATTVAKHSTTVEGAGTVSGTPLVHRTPAYMGGYHYVAPPGSELILAVSTFFRIRMTAAANVNVCFGALVEE